MNEERKQFVVKCAELLRIAKPHLVKCELMLGEEINMNHMPESEFVVVTCANGHFYHLLVDGNSLCAIAHEIFGEMVHK